MPSLAVIVWASQPGAAGVVGIVTRAVVAARRLPVPCILLHAHWLAYLGGRWSGCTALLRVCWVRNGDVGVRCVALAGRPL